MSALGDLPILICLRKGEGRSEPLGYYMATYSELLSLDLRVLPTEVLATMSRLVSNELSRRRASKAICAKQLSNFVGMRNERHYVTPHENEYLSMLLNQDWSHLFSKELCSDPKYYVYAHVRPSGKSFKFPQQTVNMQFSGMPFYIGKGSGNRAYDLKRNQGHGAHLKELLSLGASPSDIVHIVADGMTEAKALELESKLVYFFGTKYEATRKGILVNLDIPPRPELISWKQYKKARKSGESVPT